MWLPLWLMYFGICRRIIYTLGFKQPNSHTVRQTDSDTKTYIHTPKRPHIHKTTNKCRNNKLLLFYVCMCGHEHSYTGCIFCNDKCVCLSLSLNNIVLPAPAKNSNIKQQQRNKKRNTTVALPYPGTITNTSASS